jgi:internalin A
MQKQSTTWLHLAALAVLACCGLGGCSPVPAPKPKIQDADKKLEPRSLPREIAKAWSDAGAEGFDGDMPRFTLKSPLEGVLAKLPDPGAAFELWLVDATDGGLKGLAGMKSLQRLQVLKTKENLKSQVTDAGLKEVAGLTNLQWLTLPGTQVTDAGLKELATLTSLQLLSLEGTQVTDAGLKELAGRKLRHVQIPEAARTDLGLKNFLAACAPPTDLNLMGWKVTDAGLKELAGLKSLQKLTLHGCEEVTDAGLKELAGLTSLQSLGLPYYVTDAGLKELAGLKDLQTLHLGQVTDAGLKEVAVLTNLKSLSFICGMQVGRWEGGKGKPKVLHNPYDVPVTGAGLKELAGLKNLQTLTLFGMKDAGMKELAGFKSLQTLEINGDVTDAGLKELAAGMKELGGLKNLQKLDLQNNHEVTDTGLKELYGLTTLQTLWLFRTKATAEGVAALQKELPACKISR